MAEINKLSVGQALDKLRGADAASSRVDLAGKINAVDEEIHRLRATRLRVERGQRAASSVRDTPPANTGRVTKLVILGIMGGIFIVILSLALNWALF